MIRARLACLALAATTSLAAIASGGDQHIVAPNGGDFTSIQDAVDAAADGDVIVIDPTWLYYERFTVDAKSLTLVSASPHAPVLLQSHGGLASEDVITIRGLAADQIVTLDGFRVSGFDFPPLPRASLGIEQCAGSVRVQNCRLQASELYDGGLPAATPVFVTDCADVAFRACEIVSFVGSCAYDPVYGDPVYCPLTGSSPGLTVEGAGTRVALHDCDVRGATGYTPPLSNTEFVPWQGYDGSAALSATDAYIFAEGTTFLGGDGGTGQRSAILQGPAPGGPGGNGGDGVQLAGANLETVDCVIEAGSGGAGGECWDWSTGTSCSSQHGFGPDGVDGVDVVGCCHNVVPGLARRASAETLHDAAFPASVTFEGTPGDLLVLLSAPRGAFLPLSGRRGPLLLDAPSFVPGAVGVLPASGRLSVPVDLPPFAAGEETETTLLQAVFVSASREVLLSAPLTIARSRPFTPPTVLCAGLDGDLSTPTHPSASAALPPGFDVTGAAPSTTGVPYYGFSAVPYWVNGRNCIGGSSDRASVPFAIDATGDGSFDVDWNAGPFVTGASALAPGDTFVLQVAVLAPGGFEFTNALSLVLRP